MGPQGTGWEPDLVNIGGDDMTTSDERIIEILSQQVRAQQQATLDQTNALVGELRQFRAEFRTDLRLLLAVIALLGVLLAGIVGVSVRVGAGGYSVETQGKPASIVETEEVVEGY